MPFRDLRKRHGDKVAKQMTHQKRQLQLKAQHGDVPYVMAHPDMPDDEASRLLL